MIYHGLKKKCSLLRKLELVKVLLSTNLKSCSFFFFSILTLLMNLGSQKVFLPKLIDIKHFNEEVLEQKEKSKNNIATFDNDKLKHCF